MSKFVFNALTCAKKLVIFYLRHDFFPMFAFLYDLIEKKNI